MLESIFGQIGPPEWNCGIEFAGACDPNNTWFYFILAVIGSVIGLVTYRKISGKKTQPNNIKK